MSNPGAKNRIKMESHRKYNVGIVAEFPKSKHYREELSTLLGSCVTLKSEQWTLKDDIVDGEEAVSDEDERRNRHGSLLHR